MAKIAEKMLYDFSQQTALKLIYHLSRAGSDGSAYEVAEQILEQAVKDVASGRNPGDRVRCVNGRIVAAEPQSCPCDARPPK